MDMSFYQWFHKVNLSWSSACVITNSTGVGRFAITDTKLYGPVVTFSSEDNAKLPQQLKSVFKRTINWSNINQIQKHMYKTGI